MLAASTYEEAAEFRKTYDGRRAAARNSLPVAARRSQLSIKKPGDEHELRPLQARQHLRGLRVRRRGALRARRRAVGRRHDVARGRPALQADGRQEKAVLLRALPPPPGLEYLVHRLQAASADARGPRALALRLPRAAAARRRRAGAPVGGRVVARRPGSYRARPYVPVPHGRAPRPNLGNGARRARLVDARVRGGPDPARRAPGRRQPRVLRGAAAAAGQSVRGAYLG
mmetsp:Transcript_11915/g.35577  ORF Transcript_11915/g.35577 Transcript_11915/m.35577 type:complete len:229 (+) Transcript_11915:973-1659(+)